METFSFVLACCLLLFIILGLGTEVVAKEPYAGKASDCLLILACAIIITGVALPVSVVFTHLL